MRRIIVIGIMMMVLVTGCGKQEESKQEENKQSEKVEKEEREYVFENTKIEEENGKKYVETTLKNQGEEMEVGEVFIEIYKSYKRKEETTKRNIKTIIVKVDKRIGKGEEVKIKEEIELEDIEEIEIECSIAGEVKIYE